MEGIVVLFRIIFMWLSHKAEADAAKKAKKEEILKELKDVGKIKDKKQRASRLNSIVHKSKRL